MSKQKTCRDYRLPFELVHCTNVPAAEKNIALRQVFPDHVYVRIRGRGGWWYPPPVSVDSSLRLRVRVIFFVRNIAMI
jgi:hypothetical protein